MSEATTKMNIVIVGGGLTGLTAALALSKTSHDITICAPSYDLSSANLQADGRSTALLNHSIKFLEKLDIWQELAPNAFPLKIMRIIDDTRRLIRAPQIDFNSNEIGLDAFGYNILNQEFTKTLVTKLKETSNIKFTDHFAKTISPNQTTTTIILDDNSILDADFVLACDGRNSPVRSAYGIDFNTTPYPQMAIVGNIEHSLPHNDISTEFHTPSGPFTLVPMGTNKSSFVCVEDPDVADQLMQMSKSAIDYELENRSHSIIGKIKLTSKLQKFSLSTSNNSIYSNRNMVLLGEAAHVLPPIGAQGFNIGIRDIEAIVSLLENFKGDTFALAEAYQQSRLIDIKSRTGSVDLLNRSLLSDFLPVQAARSLGLYALGNISPLRKFAMHEGVEPGAGLLQLFRKNN